MELSAICVLLVQCSWAIGDVKPSVPGWAGQAFWPQKAPTHWVLPQHPHSSHRIRLFLAFVHSSHRSWIKFYFFVLWWLCSPLHKSCFPELPLIQRIRSTFRAIQRADLDMQEHRKQPADAQRGLGGGAGGCWAVSTRGDMGLCLSLGVGV